MDNFEMKPFRPSFKEGDWVVVQGMSIVGKITFIDWQTFKAEVEWEEYDYTTCDEFPLWKLEYLYDQEI